MNNKTTLLIVEDDKAIVHFISSILSVNEYRTLYAGTGMRERGARRFP